MRPEEDQPVLVLGAGSAIAQALAERFAARGHPLMLAAREPARIERVAADLAIAHHTPTTTHRFDALAIDEREDFLDGLPLSPSIVICAVGLLGAQEEAERDADLARRIIDTNFVGPALYLEAAARRLAAQDRPTALIGVGSVAGDRGRAKNYVYGAAKAGFAEYLSGLRQRHARTRLHVMTVKPGFVRTPMTDGMAFPAPLATTPERLADNVMRAFDRRVLVHYDLRWRMFMGALKLTPERLFQRLQF